MLGGESSSVGCENPRLLPVHPATPAAGWAPLLSHEQSGSSSSLTTSFAQGGDKKKEVINIAKSVRKPLPNRRSLAFILIALQGTEVVIELKDDTEVRGVIEESDRYMNVVLHNVTQTSTDGTVANMQQLYLNGMKIRYVHIPPKLNLASQIAQHSKILHKLNHAKRPVNIVDRKKRPLDQISNAGGSRDIIFERSEEK